MNGTVGRVLFWSPRVLAIGFALFLSLFAMDAFEDSRGFRETLTALLMHLIPTAIVVAILVLAWRWEWIGAVLFTAAAILYYWVASAREHPEWAWLIYAPPMVIAALFLANWVKRRGHSEPRRLR